MHAWTVPYIQDTFRDEFASPEGMIQSLDITIPGQEVMGADIGIQREIMEALGGKDEGSWV